MPGVPSGKGCDACRKQKKKCDQLKPSCSRCARLEIPCVGSGQQRYKFLYEDGSSSTPTPLPTRLSRDSSSPPSSTGRASRSLSRTPSNKQTLLANVLVSKLTAKDDLRYHLTWAYGPFFEEIPKRLGSNPALDTAVNALVSAHTTHAVSWNGKPDAESLTKYTHAVKTLRIVLNTPAKAREANTLCAVYLLMICHLYLGSEDQCDSGSSHSEGAAIILRARGYYNPRDDFETKLVQTLRGAVLFEYLINKKSKTSWTQEEWDTIVTNELDGSYPAGNMMRRLAQAPELMRRGRLALKYDMDTESLITEARDHYTVIRDVVAGRQEDYEKVRVAPVLTPRDMRVHNLFQRLYAFTIGGYLTFNCILRGLRDYAHLAELENEARHYCNEILILGEEAQVYRPLGAGWMPLFLTIAYAAAPDEEMKNRLEDVMAEFSNDFPLTREIAAKESMKDAESKLFLLE